MEAVAQVLTYFLAMIVALTFHEAAHAFAAKIQGDSTAKLAGRLTLNPTAHMDMIGTVVMPLLGAIASMPLIGWAKPVPINERNFRNARFGPFFVAFAGPAANLIMAFLGVVMLILYYRFGQEMIPQGSFLYPLVKLLSAIVLINAVLAFFNLVPIPPLDGATVLAAYLPRSWGETYINAVAPYGFFIILALAFSGGLGWVMSLAHGYIALIESLVTAFL